MSWDRFSLVCHCVLSSLFLLEWRHTIGQKNVDLAIEPSIHLKLDEKASSHEKWMKQLGNAWNSETKWGRNELWRQISGYIILQGRCRLAPRGNKIVLRCVDFSISFRYGSWGIRCTFSKIKGLKRMLGPSHASMNSTLLHVRKQSGPFLQWTVQFGEQYIPMLSCVNRDLCEAVAYVIA